MFWLSKHGATAAVEPRAAAQEGSQDHIINHTTHTERACVCVCVCVRERNTEAEFRRFYVPELLGILHVFM